MERGRRRTIFFGGAGHGSEESKSQGSFKYTYYIRPKFKRLRRRQIRFKHSRFIQNLSSPVRLGVTYLIATALTDKVLKSKTLLFVRHAGPESQSAGGHPSAPKVVSATWGCRPCISIVELRAAGLTGAWVEFTRVNGVKQNTYNMCFRHSVVMN